MLAITRIGPDGTSQLNPGSPGALSGSNLAALQPGVYSIRLSAIGTDPVNARFILKAIEDTSKLPEWAFPNGNGQGPGLSLRLFPLPDVYQPPPLLPMMDSPPRATPQPTTTTENGPTSPPPSASTPPPAPPLPTTAPTASAPPLPTTAPAASAPPPPTTAPAAVGPAAADDSADGLGPAAPTTLTAQQVPSGLILGLGGDFVGRPSPFDRIVGPATSGTSAGASASASDGIGLRIRIVSGFNPPGNPPMDGPISRGVEHEEGDVIPVPPADEMRITDLGLDNKQRVGPTRLADVGMDRLRDVIVGWVEGGPRSVPSDVVAALSHAGAQAISAEPGPIQGHARQVPFHITPVWIALASALAVQFRHQISRTFVRALSWNPVRHLGRQLARRASLPVSPRTQGNRPDFRGEGSGTGDVMPLERR